MISDVALTAIVSTIPPTLMALAAFVQSIRNGQKAEITGAKIAELEKNTNSIKDALVATTREKALLEGHELGRVAGKQEEKIDQHQITESKDT